MFYKNLFYAVNNFGRIISFNLTSINHHDKPVQVNILTEGGSEVPRVYLVESSKGDLMMVQRRFVDNEVESSKVRITKSIKVYKLVLDATNGAISECIENLR